MSAIGMTLLLVCTLGLFAWTVNRRWRLMMLGPGENRIDHVGRRIGTLIKFGIGQRRMTRYTWAGIAHILIFFGFLVLMFRSLMLFGRGYVPGFNLFILGTGSPLGDAYSFVKDIFVVLVLVGTVIFFYYRLIKKSPRLTHSFEAVIILAIIFVMMLADILYDGTEHVLVARADGATPQFAVPVFLGSIAAKGMVNLSDGALKFLEHLGFAVLDEWYVVGEFHGSEELSIRGRLGDIRGRPNEEDLREVKQDAVRLAGAMRGRTEA